MAGNKFLNMIKDGETVTIKEISGGRAFRQRMLGLGLNRGSRVRIMKNDGIGPLILGIGNGRVALGRGMAAKISVTD